MSQTEFKQIKKLGSGSFGEVFNVIRTSDGQQYAMKKVKIKQMKERDKINAINEIRLLASIEHDNVISYKEAFYDEKTENLCMIMQLASNGDLQNLLKTRQKKCEMFRQNEIWNIGYDILLGLKVLHQNCIIHRDLKPANIFFGQNFITKIGDMNVSRLTKNGLAKTQIGTPYYASPEVWENEQYGYECDIWSFGCILYQMCCFKTPFKAKNIQILYQRVIRGIYEPIPKRYSKKLSQVIRLCLKVKNRASIEEILPYFQQNATKPAVSSRKCITEPQLMKTLVFPQDFKQLKKILPRPMYKSSSQKNITPDKSQIFRGNSLFKSQDEIPAKQKITSPYYIQKSEKILPGLFNINQQYVSLRKSYLKNKQISYARILKSPIKLNNYCLPKPEDKLLRKRKLYNQVLY